MSCRGQGIMPEKFSKLGKNESVSLLSCIYGFFCMVLMLLVWYLAMHEVWIFRYLGSMDEIVCAIIYGVYITMYIYIIRNFNDEGLVKRYVMPIIAIIGSVFFVICGTGIYQLIFNNSLESLKAFGVFMLLFAILMLPSIFFYNKNGKETIKIE
jgi:amino acid transporter